MHASTAHCCSESVILRVTITTTTSYHQVLQLCFVPTLSHPLSCPPPALDSKASNLSSLSKKYRSDAKYLNTRSTYAKLAAGGVFFIMLIVYVRFWWL